jgi:Ca-activated chloride channel homolog
VSLHANVRLAHELVAIEHDSVVDLMLELVAPTVTAPSRPPVALALVVDESGSMGGEKLSTAVRCIRWLADRLGPDDRASLVGFSSQARLVSPPVAGPALAAAATSLHPQSTTNLSAGLLIGLQQLETAPGDAVKVLLLLTDGWANEGVTEPSALAALVKGAASRGVRISTIGFGHGFSEDLLTAISDAGRGDAHYAESPEAAPAIFAAELAGLTQLVAQALSVEVRPNSEVSQLDALNEYPAVPVEAGVRFDLGDAYAGDTRRLVLRLHVPALDTLGVRRVADLVVRFTSVVGAPEAHRRTLPVAVNLVSATEASEGHPDLAVVEEVQSLLADRARQEAIRRADAGDVTGSQQLLSAAATALRASPGGDALILKAGELEEEARLFGERYDAHTRKLSTYRAHRSKRSRGRE